MKSAIITRATCWWDFLPNPWNHFWQDKGYLHPAERSANLLVVILMMIILWLHQQPSTFIPCFHGENPALQWLKAHQVLVKNLHFSLKSCFNPSFCRWNHHVWSVLMLKTHHFLPGKIPMSQFRIPEFCGFCVDFFPLWDIYQGDSPCRKQVAPRRPSPPLGSEGPWPMQHHGRDARAVGSWDPGMA